MPLALLAKPTNYHHYAGAVTLANRPEPPSLPRFTHVLRRRLRLVAILWLRK